MREREKEIELLSDKTKPGSARSETLARRSKKQDKIRRTAFTKTQTDRRTDGSTSEQTQKDSR